MYGFKQSICGSVIISADYQFGHHTGVSPIPTWALEFRPEFMLEFIGKMHENVIF